MYLPRKKNQIWKISWYTYAVYIVETVLNDNLIK